MFLRSNAYILALCKACATPGSIGGLSHTTLGLYSTSRNANLRMSGLGSSVKTREPEGKRFPMLAEAPVRERLGLSDEQEKRLHVVMVDSAARQEKTRQERLSRKTQPSQSASDWESDGKKQVEAILTQQQLTMLDEINFHRQVALALGYRNGQHDGTSTVFYDDGSKCYEQHYTMGVGQGTDTGWHRSGKKAYEGQYEHGKQVGTWRWWDENGQLKSTKEYEAGKHLGDTDR